MRYTRAYALRAMLESPLRTSLRLRNPGPDGPAKWTEEQFHDELNKFRPLFDPDPGQARDRACAGLPGRSRTMDSETQGATRGALLLEHRDHAARGVPENGRRR